MREAAQFIDPTALSTSASPQSVRTRAPPCLWGAKTSVRQQISLIEECERSFGTPQGLVHSRREGTRVFYRLASERVGDLWAAVRDVAVRHVAEVNQLADEYLGERDGVEHVSAPELEERLARGDVVVLDVRPEPEYRAGHIPGAQSAPLAALASLAPKLPRRRQIVAYCRGPYCVYADDAVRLLQGRGLKARRLDVGFPEWRRAGLPVETS